MKQLKIENGTRVCKECGKETEHLIKGMCKGCYQKMWMKKKREKDRKARPKREIRNNQTLKIISEYKFCGASQSELAKKYGLSRQRISQMIKANNRKAIDK